MRFPAHLLLAIATIASACVIAQTSPKISYSEARRSARPYECRYELPSFFGGSSPFRSHIRGDDLHTVYAMEIDPRTYGFKTSSRAFEDLARTSVLHYWRIGGFGYRWVPQDDKAIKFDLAAVAAVTSGGAAAVEGYFLVAPVPPGDALCIPIQRAVLGLPPNVVFTDVTKRMIEEAKQGQARP